MLALLLAVALIALTLLALHFAGTVAAVITGIALLNVLVLVLGARSRRARESSAEAGSGWRPSSFRRLGEPSVAAVADVEGATGAEATAAEQASGEAVAEQPAPAPSITAQRR